MGMFDSLDIVLDDREIEVQTKRFDGALTRYRPGDCGDGPTPGVRVYFGEHAMAVAACRVGGSSCKSTREWPAHAR